MEFGTLEIFVAAVEEKSLSRAAERASLVTSAASKRISELERRLGVKLLDRHGRGVTPTPAGEVLYQQARAILRQVGQARTSLAAFSASGLPQIRLVANSSTVQQFLPREISAFAQVAPGARIDLTEAFSYDVPRLVADGEADIGLYHAAHPAAGVVSMRYRSDLEALVVPLGHPLAGRSSVALDDALDYDFLGFFPRHSLEEFLLLIGPGLSRPLRVRAQVSNPEARCGLVREGLGVAIVPSAIARHHAGRMGLAVIPMTDAWAHRQMWICVRDAAKLSSAGKAFLQQLQSRADEPPP
ncbi:LysR family transcriptional regulator [Xylophilus rhododendri]|uniref:LysR family transcriptional regulator n=1 Tax=Xylophilus rhododendri TaxID=2697032 RepID=A0A857IZ51_9BURK|nr:LysR family transcriptional regulator [Xylophilus rhododendri]QHI96870.1 LysR family transcriptional regulator [Xylophilus rhododendri]